MYHSPHVLRFKEVTEKIKNLTKERRDIMNDMRDDIVKALISKMDWDAVTIDSMDVGSEKSILISVTNPAEKDCRYVFAVSLREHDEFYLNLQFRENFSKY